MLEKLKGLLPTKEAGGKMKTGTIVLMAVAILYLLMCGRQCEPDVICIEVEVRDTVYIDRYYYSPHERIEYVDVINVREVRDTILVQDSVVITELRYDTVVVTVPHNIYRDTIPLDSIREIQLLHRVDGWLRKSEFNYITVGSTWEERPQESRRGLPPLSLYATLQSDGLGLRPGVAGLVNNYMVTYDYNVNTKAHSLGVGVRVWGK
jgi:hypothetical protein